MDKQRTKAFLGLGSNMGEREKLLVQAVNLINQTPGIRVLQSSFIYETDPVGYTEQDAFLNIVIKIETSLCAAELLSRTQEVEAELGRVRTIRWGPRTLDIDILLYGNEWLNDGDLQIPHPRMTERAFVLVPLAEIAPEVQIPYKAGGEVEFLHISDALAKVDGKEGVRKWNTLDWEQSYDKIGK